MRVLYNNCYGGFGLSLAATHMYLETFLHKSVFVYDEHCKKWIDPYADDYRNIYYDCIFVTDKTLIPDSAEIDYDTRRQIDESIKCRIYDRLYDPLFRKDRLLLFVFDKLGSDAFSGACSKIAVETIPDRCMYTINEYDGLESVTYSFVDNTCTCDADITFCCDCSNCSQNICSIWSKPVYINDFCSRAVRKADNN